MQSVSAGADSTVADSTINNKSGTEHLETGCSVPFPLPHRPFCMPTQKGSVDLIERDERLPVSKVCHPDEED
jgi:hypothetical protein